MLAAAAALIMQGKKKFLDQNVSIATPKSNKIAFRSTAIDMASSGFDFNTGFGFINPDSAMRTFAAPVSYLIQLGSATRNFPMQWRPLLRLRSRLQVKILAAVRLYF
jgi:hypothetical protein